MVTVDIFNMSEDVWPFIQAISDEGVREREIDENASLGDREIWCLREGEAVAICPRPVAAEFIKYAEEIRGDRVQVWVPEVRNGLICQSIIGDERFRERLGFLGRKHGGINLVSYCVSKGFYNLVRALRSEGVEVATPEAPEEKDGWVVDNFGSKSGIRQWGVEMAPGVVCRSVNTAIKAAKEKLRAGKGVVIKTNKAHSGMGVLIVRKEEAEGAEKKIAEELAKNDYWKLFPLVVEEWIEAEEKIGGGFPSGEMVVRKTGETEFLYSCGMRVTRKGEFAGMEIGAGVLPGEVEKKIEETVRWLGKKYAAKGYRGYFDVDFVAGKSGKLYVTESNVRRTGGTHVFILAQKLYGRDFQKKIFVVSNNWREMGRVMSWGEVISRLEPVRWDKQKNKGVVIMEERTLKLGRLAYVIFEEDRKTAERTEERMGELLA